MFALTNKELSESDTDKSDRSDKIVTNLFFLVSISNLGEIWSLFFRLFAFRVSTNITVSHDPYLKNCQDSYSKVALDFHQVHIII